MKTASPFLDLEDRPRVEVTFEGATLSLSASATDSDLPAQALSYSLDAGSLALGMTIDANSGAFSWTPGENDGGSTPSVTVIVSDGITTDSQSFTITVNELNDAPVITSDGGGASASITVDEDQTLVTTVTASDTDLPADILNFSIFGGADATLFTIDSGSGVLSFVSARDFETESDANTDGIYEVEVQVSDGSDTDTQQISVTLNDVDEFNVGAPIDNDPGANQVSEFASIGASVGLTVSATDLDGTDSVGYTLTDDAGGRFAIDPVSGQVTVAAGLSGASGTWHVTVLATSTDGSSATQTFAIDVLAGTVRHK